MGIPVYRSKSPCLAGLRKSLLGTLIPALRSRDADTALARLDFAFWGVDPTVWLERIHYDCFPSGHTEVTLLVWWSARKISKCLFWTYSAYTMCMVFATVYLRYRDSIDTMAGALLAMALLSVAPYLYGSRQLHGNSGDYSGQEP